MKIAGKHAVVTGGGTGIGAAIAHALAREGAKVSVLGRRVEPIEEVAAAIGPAAFFTRCDVTDPAQVESAMEVARKKHGPIGILVNNAGAATSVPFHRLDHEQWRTTLAVNLDGVFHCCRAALPDLLEAGQGRIVTIASIAGLVGAPYIAHYVAAKHGAVGLMRALAAEYAGKGVTANAICPGYVETDLAAQAVANIRAKTGRSEEEARAELARMNPSGRMILPEEVAGAALDLIRSDRTGEAVEIA